MAGLHSKWDQLAIQSTSYPISSKHFLYVKFVLLLHPAANSWEASLEIPSACCLCLIVFKQLILAVLLQSEDVVCQKGPTEASVVVGTSEESLLTGLVMLGTTAVTSTLVLLPTL